MLCPLSQANWNPEPLINAASVSGTFAVANSRHLRTAKNERSNCGTGRRTGRGRDGSYLPPPAQIRTCGTTAYLKDVLTRLPTQRASEIDELLTHLAIFIARTRLLATSELGHGDALVEGRRAVI